VAVSRQPRRRAVFLDKDGTLVEDMPYNVDPVLVRLKPDAGKALGALAGHGFSLFLASNQSGVARGLFPLDALEAVERRLGELLAPFGVGLTACYFCPHHPEGTVPEFAAECGCRKPSPGLLLRAAEEYEVDLSSSWLIGDILDDVEAGNRAGCRTVLLGNGGESEWRPGEFRRPDAVAGGLSRAAGIILAGHGRRKEEECDAIRSN
jgi:D-glycero-D-manno-heptose 1,7-bisphosphate phosphatase